MNLFVAFSVLSVIYFVLKEKVIFNNPRNFIFEFSLLLQEFDMVLSIIFVTKGLKLGKNVQGKSLEGE